MVEGKLWAHKRRRIIHLAGEISDDSASFLTQALIEFNKTPLTIYINSAGGDQDAGFAMYDLIMLHPAAITIAVIGACESAALLPFIACSRRFLAPHARLKIHHGSYRAPTQHQREAIVDAKELDYEDNLYMQLMAKHTGTPLKVIKRLARFGQHFHADQAIKYGFSHGILEYPTSKIIANKK